MPHRLATALTIAATLAAAGLPPAAARADSARRVPSKRMTLACQHNIGDGRTLVVDGRLLPDGARFKVVSFRPTRVEDGWSYGPCTIDVTH